MGAYTTLFLELVTGAMGALGQVIDLYLTQPDKRSIASARLDNGKPHQDRNMDRQARQFLESYVQQTFMRIFCAKISILSHFECSRCAICCRTMPPALTLTEMKDIAHYIGLSNLKKFRRKYVLATSDSIFIRGAPCPFLREKECSIYTVRPESCEMYPFKVDLPLLLDVETCSIAKNIKEKLDEVTPEEAARFQSEIDKKVADAAQKAMQSRGLTAESVVGSYDKRLANDVSKLTGPAGQTARVLTTKDCLEALAEKLGRRKQLESERFAEFIRRVRG